MPHYLSDDELKRTSPAEIGSFRSPVPTQIVSNGEYNPLPQTREQQKVEARIKDLADDLGRRHGMDRRRFHIGMVLYEPKPIEADLAQLDVAVHHVIGFHDEQEASLYREADGIITEMHPVTDDMMATFSRCKIIACASTGFDYVEHFSAAKRGIWVTNCPGYCTDEVATHTIALLLSQARRLPQVRQLVRANEWDPRPARPMDRHRPPP